MSNPNRIAENLDLLDRQTALLVDDLSGLPADGWQEPSLCPGWTRAHIAAHLARNADALVNLVRWAEDGQERPAYASEESRDRDIEEGAHRDPKELVDDVADTAARFREACSALLGPAGDAEIRSRTGNRITGGQLPAMRLLEVVFHHVDLRLEFGFDDVDHGWVDRTLRRGVRQWEAGGDAPALTLRTDRGEELPLAGGGPVVEGTAGELLLWLARGVPGQITSPAGLPIPPPWS